VDQSKLVTLFDLLRDGYTPAQLATAIEAHGVTGWDRFGRFGPFKPTSDGARSALDSLADYQLVLNTAYDRADQELSNLQPGDIFTGVEDPLDSIFDDERNVDLHRFGWPPDTLPPIDRTVRHPPPPKSKVSTRSADETLNALGGLLLVLRDLHKSGKTMMMPAEKALIGKIVEKYPRFPGLSESNLINKFAASKKIVEADAPLYRKTKILP